MKTLKYSKVLTYLSAAIMSFILVFGGIFLAETPQKKNVNADTVNPIEYSYSELASGTFILLPGCWYATNCMSYLSVHGTDTNTDIYYTFDLLSSNQASSMDLLFSDYLDKDLSNGIEYFYFCPAMSLTLSRAYGDYNETFNLSGQIFLKQDIENSSSGETSDSSSSDETVDSSSDETVDSSSDETSNSSSSETVIESSSVDFVNDLNSLLDNYKPYQIILGTIALFVGLFFIYKLITK